MDRSSAPAGERECSCQAIAQAVQGRALCAWRGRLGRWKGEKLLRRLIAAWGSAQLLNPAAEKGLRVLRQPSVRFALL
jgi:hypothetical protein